VLLILDNCEHLLAACADLAAHLLSTCPHLRLLATSREALLIDGEVTWRVPSLSRPGADSRFPMHRDGQSEAAQLFAERAAAALPGFALSEENWPAVADICRRLDGIPLALELAAARIRALSVEQIALRLSDRFRLLTSGDRTAQPRQQTLRGALDWSHELLTPPERQVFRRVSVFAGGWSVEAAESVCVSDGLESSDVFDLLSHLVEKSLVVAERVRGARSATASSKLCASTVRRGCWRSTRPSRRAIAMQRGTWSGWSKQYRRRRALSWPCGADGLTRR
jgi:predicted ATPase